MTNPWRDPTVIGAIIGGIFLMLITWIRSGEFRRRRKIHRLRANLQATCPHVSRHDEDGNVFPTKLYYPIENGHFRCGVCNKRLSSREAEATLRYWHDASQERQEKLRRARREAQELRNKLDPLGNWTEE